MFHGAIKVALNVEMATSLINAITRRQQLRHCASKLTFESKCCEDTYRHTSTKKILAPHFAQQALLFLVVGQLLRGKWRNDCKPSVEPASLMLGDRRVLGGVQQWQLPGKASALL